jgi:putative ABC transport system permease protein
MSAALRERPVAAGPGEGGVAARRAIIRWVWRVFRREWRQQLLALGLLTVAVAATVAGAAIAANTASKASTTGTFGTADYLVSIPGSDPDLPARLAAIKQSAGTVDVIENQKIAAGSVHRSCCGLRTRMALTGTRCWASSRAATRLAPARSR